MTLLARSGLAVALFNLIVMAPMVRCAPADESGRGLIPQPAHLVWHDGAWTLTRRTRLVAGAGARREANHLAETLSPALGWTPPVRQDSPQAGDIELRLDPAVARLGEEGYRLVVTRTGVTITASTETGLFYGGITLRQLLPAEILRSIPQPSGSTTGAAQPAEPAWTTPCVEVEDQPRFGWRGLLLDPARHFLPVPAVEKFIDLMALHKLNRLQLHLTDDQGWRLHLPKYPRLTEVGAVRQESPKPGQRDQGDGTPYGPFFYTPEEIRRLVSYAEARHVTLVPEIEIPGHFRAALAAYPEFSCTGGPFAVRTRWGVEPDILCPGNDAAVAFAQGILQQVCDLFPSPFIHIGGDEAPRERWQHCPKCQARLKAEGLKSEAQLQTWLNHRLEETLASRGRRLIGWDEILEGGLTPGALVTSWRGVDGGIAAARSGHDVVMSPTSHCYLDYAQAQGDGEPEAIGGFVPLDKVYLFEPVPAALAREHQGHVLGAQGNLWSEYLWTARDVEYFAFPRAAALAEVVWSPAANRNFDDFQNRLRVQAQRWDVLGVNYRRGTTTSPRPVRGPDPAKR